MQTATPTTTILVVDDDPFTRGIIRVAMRPLPYTILEAGNGREGLDMYEEHRPDLLMIDLRMPVVNGMELLKRLGPATETTPVLVISGEGDLNDAVEAIHCGAWDYLTKPFKKVEALQHAVAKALERAALIRENENYRRHLEHQVQERTRALEKANSDLEQQFLKQQKLSVIGTLASGMAHDFRNFLGAINSSADAIILTMENGDMPLMEDVERIQRVCQRGKASINSLLHFTGQMNEEYVTFPLRDVVLEALDIIRSTTPSHIRIEADINDDLGTMTGDPVQIQQVLMNLGANAVQALDGVTSGARIDIAAAVACDPVLHHDSRQVIITVRDNGPGVPEEDLGRLCEPFFTSKAKGQGTGLGLYVSRKIVSSLRGSLQFANTAGGGLRVSVSFPVSRPDISQAQPGRQERILVVENDLQTGNALCSGLDHLQYQTTLARSMERGMDRIRTESFAAILIGHVETEALHRLHETVRAFCPDTPLLISTTEPSVCAGMGITLPRPVEIPELTRVLRDSLDRRH